MPWKPPGCCGSPGMLAASRQGGQGSAVPEGALCLPPLPAPLPLGPSQTTPSVLGTWFWALSPSMTLHGHAWSGGGSCLHANHTELCAALLLPAFHSRGSHPPSEDAQSASVCVCLPLFPCLKQDGGTELPPLLAGTSRVAEAFCPPLACTPTVLEHRTPSRAVTSFCFPEGPVPVSWGPFSSCPPSSAHSLSASLSFPPCPPTCLF